MACGDTENVVGSEQGKKSCNGDCENCGAATSLREDLDALTKIIPNVSTDRPVVVETGLSN